MCALAWPASSKCKGWAGEFGGRPKSLPSPQKIKTKIPGIPLASWAIHLRGSTKEGCPLWNEGVERGELGKATTSPGLHGIIVLRAKQKRPGTQASQGGWRGWFREMAHSAGISPERCCCLCSSPWLKCCKPQGHAGQEGGDRSGVRRSLGNI